MNLLRGIGEGEVIGSDVVAFLERTSEGPPLNDLQADALPRYLQGFICGLAIHDIVGLHSIEGVQPSRVDTLVGLCKKMAPKGTIAGVRLTAKYLNQNRWDQIKPVLHLWAAYAAKFVSTGNGIFPCRLSELADFMSQSEWWLNRCSDLRRPRSSAGLLNVDTAWRLAEHHRGVLPAYEFSFERMAPENSTLHIAK
jgi:hypothetical protein